MLIQVNAVHPQIQHQAEDRPLYQVFLLPDPVEAMVDFTLYRTTAASLLFLSPYQHLTWIKSFSRPVMQVLFHGDFYCIEYHKKEVACNGLLFNNIYLQPFVAVPAATYLEIERIIRNMGQELNTDTPFSAAVVKAYLQLLLALSSKEKRQQIDLGAVAEGAEMPEGFTFQQLLETNFSVQRSVNFYAERMNLTSDVFSRKIKNQLGRLPSTLIQERVVLESKKLLHLTYLSVKEIALKLHFDDEHYFSRYFKKYVGVSPTDFRLQVGISIAASK
ncbi:AraC family transcriptional regulator [Parapedobacter lycopersici]|uniref:helix-turn-helix domain-containing protein n=1 Tax=Parapedobacter lycopersici TaxID=1864939 RepID=UPI003342A9D8